MERRELAHDRDKWLVLANTVTNFRRPLIAGKFLTNKNTISFQKDSSSWVSELVTPVIYPRRRLMRRELVGIAVLLCLDNVHWECN
jgi:hypothetical protein